jgi:hypothetical protein
MIMEGGEKLQEAAPIIASESLSVSPVRYVDIRLPNHTVLYAIIV